LFPYSSLFRSLRGFTLRFFQGLTYLFLYLVLSRLYFFYRSFLTSTFTFILIIVLVKSVTRIISWMYIFVIFTYSSTTFLFVIRRTGRLSAFFIRIFFRFFFLLRFIKLG